MNAQAHNIGRAGSQSPTAHRLLGNPLDFIHEDHMRERTFCAALIDLACTETAMADLAGKIAEFLGQELPLHIADEEQDLFPLLRRRCMKEDEIGRVLERLHTDRRHAAINTPTVLTILKKFAAGTELSGEDNAALSTFADHSRRHLILENAVILPLARVRLTSEDLDTLRLRMMQRRGLDRLMERPHAE